MKDSDLLLLTALALAALPAFASEPGLDDWRQTRCPHYTAAAGLPDEVLQRPSLVPAITGEPAPAGDPPDETLIPDPRAGLTPSQMIERKLALLLRGRAIPLSQTPSHRPRRP